MNPDFLVIGAGVAGLRAAIELASAGRVLVVAKDSLTESSSEYAQGGIAAALSGDDEVGLHEQDTIAAGDGLCNVDAVRVLVEAAPRAIEELIGWGAEFDREGARLLFAREGAHSRSRVLHAHGDSTGHEIARTLAAAARTLPTIQMLGGRTMMDLVPGADGGVAGVTLLNEETGEVETVLARAVLLATGGLGRVYSDTTNPDVATGDGVAAAWRAGAAIRDIEFIQFHPTALYLPNAPRFLLSEALRGEGAVLRNRNGEAFMERYHPMKDLAPRDVVSRSMVMEMRRTRSTHVSLDLTRLSEARLRERFPRIFETCLRYGVNLAENPAPVHPAAHYAMGGVATDLDGRTSLGSLYAAGEAACTGVHGANRLASNSLLEGLVFGARAGKAMGSEKGDQSAGAPVPPMVPSIAEDELRSLAEHECGIVRDFAGLTKAIERLDTLSEAPLARPKRSALEIRNIHAVARLIARGALARQESRGGHFRIDFPQKDSRYQKHSIQRAAGPVEFE